jgi:general secretion pathway protein M
MNLQKLRLWWEQRLPRERNVLLIGGAIVGIALVWWMALAPALRTLAGYEVRQSANDAQLRTMLDLQAQAQALQSQPKLSAADAGQALQTSVQLAFGSQADIAMSGGAATVTLRGVSPQALAQWLTNVRVQAHTVPTTARLNRSASGWSGTVQVGLPAQ